MNVGPILAGDLLFEDVIPGVGCALLLNRLRRTTSKYPLNPSSTYPHAHNRCLVNCPRFALEQGPGVCSNSVGVPGALDPYHMVWRFSTNTGTSGHTVCGELEARDGANFYSSHRNKLYCGPFYTHTGRDRFTFVDT